MISHGLGSGSCGPVALPACQPHAGPVTSTLTFRPLTCPRW
jgi:hypothetical protein